MHHLYLMTKLFNTLDKKRTCDLEKYLLKLSPSISIYMPYRDTKEDSIVGDWKYEIFSRDIAELNKCDLLIGYWDGPAFDEGIGFEIGYAISIGKSVIIINDDFLLYGNHHGLQRLRFPDPLVLALDIPIIGDIFSMGELHEYENDLSKSFNNTLSKSGELALKKLNAPSPISIFNDIAKNDGNIYIEVANSVSLRKSIESLRKYNNNIVSSMRFNDLDQQNVAISDLKAALSASKVYIVSHGPEMSPGTSIICGFCYGRGIPYYIIDDREVSLFSMTGAIMRTNLMIDMGSRGYIDISELITHVKS